MTENQIIEELYLLADQEKEDKAAFMIKLFLEEGRYVLYRESGVINQSRHTVVESVYMTLSESKQAMEKILKQKMGEKRKRTYQVLKEGEFFYRDFYKKLRLKSKPVELSSFFGLE